MITTTLKTIDPRELTDLYSDAGWGEFHGSEHILLERFEKSTFSAFSTRDEKVVGCIRVLSDRVSVTWVAEILVAKAYQRQGIGRELVAYTLKEFQHTDIYMETFDKCAGFFEKCGLMARRSMVVCSKKHD